MAAATIASDLSDPAAALNSAASDSDHSGLGDAEWYTIHIVALTTILLTIAGSLYIIILSLIKMRRESMAFLQMLPMFISIGDGISGVFHGADHAISLSLGRVADGPGCIVLGFGTFLGANTAPFWVSACAVYIHLLIVRDVRPNVGPGGLWLHLVCWGIPLIINIVALALGKFGREALWCGLPGDNAYFSVGVVGPALLLSIVMYVWTWRHIRRRAAPLSSHGSGSRGRSRAGSSPLNPLSMSAPANPEAFASTADADFRCASAQPDSHSTPRGRPAAQI
ncbi:hypothetical protein HK405_013411, partial [Cladochytrium tenue]